MRRSSRLLSFLFLWLVCIVTSLSEITWISFSFYRSLLHPFCKWSPSPLLESFLYVDNHGVFTDAYFGKLTTLNFSLVLYSGYRPTLGYKKGQNSLWKPYRITPIKTHLFVLWFLPLLNPFQWLPATPKTSPTSRDIWKKNNVCQGLKMSERWYVKTKIYAKGSKCLKYIMKNPPHHSYPPPRVLKLPLVGAHPDHHNTWTKKVVTHLAHTSTLIDLKKICLELDLPDII